VLPSSQHPFDTSVMLKVVQTSANARLTRIRGIADWVGLAPAEDAVSMERPVDRVVGLQRAVWSCFNSKTEVDKEATTSFVRLDTRKRLNWGPLSAGGDRCVGVT
jgi:hypothetical protein